MGRAMTIIQEIAEETRREMLQCQRAGVRHGAAVYARSTSARLHALHGMDIIFSPALPPLKRALRAQMQARKAGSWRFSLPRYIAILQCIGGELILEAAATINNIEVSS